MRRKAVFIVNPRAGRGRARIRTGKAMKLLSEAGLDCLHFEAERPGQGREIAKIYANKVDVLVSVGGDGTLNEVVNGLSDIRSETPVAIIPAGTANMVARELGLPQDLAALSSLAIKSNLRRLDLGSAGSRGFILCASAGFDASLVNAVAHKRGKRGLALWMYFSMFFSQEFRYRFTPMRVFIDGALVEEKSSDTIIGNMDRYGLFFQMFKGASPDDGLLDVCCLKTGGHGRLLRYTWAAYRGILDTLADVAYYRGKQIALEAEDRIPFQMDGDPWGGLPVSVEVRPKAVTLCVP
jgi:diacylglycerol kinase (ATP)